MTVLRAPRDPPANPSGQFGPLADRARIAGIHHGARYFRPALSMSDLGPNGQTLHDATHHARMLDLKGPPGLSWVSASTVPPAGLIDKPAEPDVRK